MNTNLFLSLMDPAGAPAHPVLFLVLGVVTFALHITAVNVMLGSLGLAIGGTLSKNAYWQRLGAVMGGTAKVAVAVAVVLGVAPLLFVQVIYDPFWYVSNVLSARWVLAFLVILCAAYLAMHRWYAVRNRVWLWVAMILFFHCALIMHALANEMLSPADWMNWYAPDGVITPNGANLKAVSYPRLVFFLALSLPVTAAWLFGYRRQLLSAGETDFDYVDFVENVAHKTARWGSAIVILAGLAWMVALPDTMRWFAGSVWSFLAVIPLAYFAAMSAIQVKRRLCIFCNYMAFGMTVVMVLVLSALREVLRYGTLLDAVGWNPLDYKVVTDWPTTLIFFGTFLLVGGTALTYLLTLAWKLGTAPKDGPIDMSGTETIGRTAVAFLSLWVIGYFAVGAWVVWG